MALGQEIKKKGKDKGKEKSKKRKDMEFHWSKRSTRNQKQLSDLEDEVTHPYTEHNLSFKVVKTNFDALLKIMVEGSHLYDQQNDRELQTNKEEMKAFLGINHVMTINKLPNITSYWNYG